MGTYVSIPPPPQNDPRPITHLMDNVVVRVLISLNVISTSYYHYYFNGSLVLLLIWIFIFFKPNRSLPVVSVNLFSHPPLCAIIRNETGGVGGLEKTVRKEWNRNSWLSDFIGLLHNEFIALRFGTGQYKLLWTAQFSHKAIQIFGRVFPSSSSATFNGTPLSDWS